MGVLGPSVCLFYFSDGETIDHLFAECNFTRRLYDYIAYIFDVTLHYEFGFHHFFLQATRIPLGPFSIVTVVWLIWQTRNRLVHDGVHPNFVGCLVQP